MLVCLWQFLIVLANFFANANWRIGQLWCWTWVVSCPMIQPRLYSTNSQQQPPQGALYCKVKTLFEDELGNSGKKYTHFQQEDTSSSTWLSECSHMAWLVGGEGSKTWCGSTVHKAQYDYVRLNNITCSESYWVKYGCQTMYLQLLKIRLPHTHSSSTCSWQSIDTCWDTSVWTNTRVTLTLPKAVSLAMPNV